MKLTTLLLFVALMNVSAASLAQRVTIKEKKITLDHVFREIRKQTGYDVLVSTDKLNTDKKIDANFDNMALSDILDELLKGSGLGYLIKDKTIVIQEKKEAQPVQSNAPPVTVTGKVTNELGEPMSGVTVREKGTNNATITDQKGSYHLTVTDNKTLVDFSYIGYEAQELAAKDLPDGSSIIMKPAPQNLQEVVINKGYYDEKRELSTGNVDIVTAKTIEEQPVSDPIQALIGRVPGLNIQQTSGIPGSYATIHINGLNSISNGNDPLYVIDGVPFSSVSLSSTSMSAGAIVAPGGGNFNTNGGGISPFSALNPEDIENIEILKDADATAIYGSRGASGVILITTKSGKAGATKFSIDANQGIGSVGHFMDLLNTQQYVQMRGQGFQNDGEVVPSIKSNPYDYNYDVDGVWDTNRYTNWQKVLIGGNAQWTNINGNLSGGNANTQFLIGGGYNRQSTVYPGDDGDTKASVHLSITHTSDNQKLHTQLTVSYVNDNNVMPTTDLTNDIALPPDAPALYMPNGSLNWEDYNGSSTFLNPLAPTLNSATSVSNNLISNLHLSYILLPGLTLNGNFGYNHDEMNESYLQLGTLSLPPPVNISSNSYNTFATTVTQTWIIEPQLAYTRTIAKGKLNALIGTSFQQQKYSSLTDDADDFGSDALITNPQAATYYYIFGDNYTLYRYNAIYARIGYNWDEKYLLNITARRDGSSRFGSGRQWGNFGAIGAGWIFSKEKFIEENLPCLNFGKLRYSYGTTGNDQIPDYGYLSSYSTVSGTYQGVTQLVPARLPNTNYGWETDKKMQIGLDLGFLKDRIDLSVDYYRNRSSDQLVTESIVSASGFAGYQANLPATVQNTGLETELHTVNIKGKDFNWSTSFNFTLPENKLIAFPGLAQSSYVYTDIIGQPITIKEVYQYAGVNPQTGLYTFVTHNLNGRISNSDKVPVNPTQKFYGGIQNSFSYENFSLDIFIQFVKQLGYGYQYYLQDPGNYSNVYPNQPTAVLNAWQTTGQVTNVEKFGTSSTENSPYGIFRNSTGVFTDASFIRIKNVSLSYRLPANWQDWCKIHNAKIYLQGQNLYTFTKYIGLDPETQNLGLPPLRMITAGIHGEF